MTVVAADDPVSSVAITQSLPAARAVTGPFWPVYGERARMGLPIRTPPGFPATTTALLGPPQVTGTDDTVDLTWHTPPFGGPTAVAVASDTLLGPPDLFHTERGMAFGELAVLEDYRVDRRRGGTVEVTCKTTLANGGSAPLTDLEYALFVPRALMDPLTGEERPLMTEATVSARNVTDGEPLPLLVCDGLARAAWGWRCVVRLASFAPGARHTFSVHVRGRPVDGAVIIPVVTLVAVTPARFWPSSTVTFDAPRTVVYDDYTHFNVVVADSRAVHLTSQGGRIAPSSDLVR